MVSVNPSNHEVTANAGPDKRILRKAWKDSALTVTQLELIQRLVELELGFADIEEFLRTQNGKFKSMKFQFQSKSNYKHSKQINILMRAKLADAEEKKREAKKVLNDCRNDLKVTLGENTRKYRNTIKHLRKEASKLMKEARAKNKTKIDWLLKKYRSEDLNNNENFVVPDDIIQFKDVQIFNSEFVAPDEDCKPDIITIGDIQPPLDEDELAALSLPPKTAVNGSLKLEDFKVEIGMCSTKLRWQIRKEEAEESEGAAKTSEEDEELIEEIESKARIPYDAENSSLDLRKRRVTDTKDNSRVYLPKPVSVLQETNIFVRENAYERIFNDFYQENCNEKGQQSRNLSKSEMAGIAKLKKRVANNTIIIMETDKSGKLAAATPEAYLEMGQEHVSKDREIDEEEIKERENHLNGHVSMLLKVTNMGGNWKHEKRFRESNIKHSGYAAVLSLLLKDHKKVPEGEVFKTRPVVAANEGIGTSISNILSEIIEPLADSLEDKMEVISTEDFLYRVNECNKLLQEQWTDKDVDVACYGADVKALFPSLSARNTARIVRDVFIDSNMEVDGFNYKSAAMYVRYGMTDSEIHALRLTRVMPVRRYHKNRAPQITSKEALSGDPD